MTNAIPIIFHCFAVHKGKISTFHSRQSKIDSTYSLISIQNQKRAIRKTPENTKKPSQSKTRYHYRNIAASNCATPDVILNWKFHVHFDKPRKEHETITEIRDLIPGR
ncbi:hypothetical protein CDAR_437101 [Caerostris darwini]|uniref:Uncharacterized protein n=1 Tax=Caerostris darwini TaxID=1538125 RepID=A0AAV4TTI9_9ARAC|nr:hypothetical protein CDAR_437101 [Caerostris darwini]